MHLTFNRSYRDRLPRVSVIVSIFLATIVVDSGVHAEKPQNAPSKTCDIRATDWKNFQFGKDKLKDGYKDLSKDHTFGCQVQSDRVVYGDLTRDGKLEAYVPEGPCGGDWCSNYIWVFEEDSSCHPKLLAKFLSGTGTDMIAGDQLIFVAQTNPNEEAHPIAVSYVDGKFVEVQPKTAIPKEWGVGPWVSPASLRHAATIPSNATGGDIYVVIDAKREFGIPSATKVGIASGKFKRETTVRPKFNQIAIRVHPPTSEGSSFGVFTDGAVSFGPIQAATTPDEWKNADQKLKW